MNVPPLFGRHPRNYPDSGKSWRGGRRIADGSHVDLRLGCAGGRLHLALNPQHLEEGLTEDGTPVLQNLEGLALILALGDPERRHRQEQAQHRKNHQSLEKKPPILTSIYENRACFPKAQRNVFDVSHADLKGGLVNRGQLVDIQSAQYGKLTPTLC